MTSRNPPSSEKHHANPGRLFRWKSLFSLVALVSLVFILPAAVTKGVKASKDDYSDWCQCAIFVVNHLGLEILPGDYYLAGLFGEADENGRSWMEYQGFRRLAKSELPGPGDVMVIRPAGRVFVPESTDSPRFTPVEAEWAGHIGVIETAQSTDVDGRSYLRLVFLSSNWGVNSDGMFVRSGCFNVDRSTVWVERGDPDFSFWREIDPAMQRRHILNITRQLANGYYHIGPDGKIDGYPISGPGMIAYAWNAEIGQFSSVEELMTRIGSEVPLTSIQEGDAVFSSGGDIAGIFAGFTLAPNEKEPPDNVNVSGMIYWFNPAAASFQGPVVLGTIPGLKADDGYRIYRSNHILPEFGLTGFDIRTEGRESLARVVVRNNGGQVLILESVGIQITSPQGRKVETDVEPAAYNVEVHPGQDYFFSTSIAVLKRGVYFVEPYLRFDGQNKTFPEMRKVQYLIPGG